MIYAARRDIENISPVILKVFEKQLTDRQKCYIIMYYQDGVPIRAIADLYGVNPSTVSRTIKRGRQKLVSSAKIFLDLKNGQSIRENNI